MWDLKKKPTSNATSLIAAGLEVNGAVSFSGALHVDGKIKGDVSAADDPRAVVTIGPKGCIEGQVKVPRVVLEGAVVGDIVASEGVELGPSAHVTGNIYYQKIEMALGAAVNGRLIPMADGGSLPETASEPVGS